YVNGYNLCPSSFTHELLHIYIKDKKINIANELEKHITENHTLRTIFSLPLRTHIGNCLEHIKMLPIYLNLGFPNEKFLSDYNESKMDSLTILQIKTTYKNYNIYNKEVVDFYIGKFFAMKACNNNSFNYFNYYSELENIDSELFYSLNNFWENWINIIDSRNYKPILEKFIEDLKNWTKNKKFI
ncbi:hypothetical protein, partial [Flavobacterium alkalisoli]|uniref:hypothetical protein n=1 Tax=Flavobacterium alkalisoli TaxID=2602769 RepID=UPI003A90E039